MPTENTDTKFDIDLGAWFFIIGALILWFIDSNKINPSNIVLALSTAFITSSLVLTGFLAIPNILNRVKKRYRDKAIEIRSKISLARKKQVKITDVNRLIFIDKEILQLREDLKEILENSFRNKVIWPIALFSITIIATYQDLGIYIKLNNSLLMVSLFIFGVYRLVVLANDILLILDDEVKTKKFKYFEKYQY